MGLFSIFKKKKKIEEKPIEAPKATPKLEPAVKEAPKAAPKVESTVKEAPKAAPKAESAVKETPKAAPKVESTVKEAPKASPKAESAVKEAPKAAPKAESAVKEAPKAAPKAEPAVKGAPKTNAQKPTPKKTAKPEPKPEQKEQPKAEPVSNAKNLVGKFEIKKSKDDRYVFNLYAANKVIVATSQIYSSSTAAVNGIKSVIENAEKAPVEDQTLKEYETLNYPKWEIYLDKGNQYRFRLNASNGSCICHSQGYTTKASCKNGIESIKKTAKNAVIDKSYLKKDQ